jgi:hypothetical protein
MAPEVIVVTLFPAEETVKVVELLTAVAAEAVDIAIQAKTATTEKTNLTPLTEHLPFRISRQFHRLFETATEMHCVY